MRRAQCSIAGALAPLRSRLCVESNADGVKELSVGGKESAWAVYDPSYERDDCGPYHDEEDEEGYKPA